MRYEVISMTKREADKDLWSTMLWPTGKFCIKRMDNVATGSHLGAEVTTIPNIYKPEVTPFESYWQGATDDKDSLNKDWVRVYEVKNYALLKSLSVT